MPRGDSKPRVVWPGQKRFELLTGGVHTILLEHPYRIPRVLGRAHCGLDVLRGQEMHKVFGLFLLSDSANVSHAHSLTMCVVEKHVPASSVAPIVSNDEHVGNATFC